MQNWSTNVGFAWPALCKALGEEFGRTAREIVAYVAIDGGTREAPGAVGVASENVGNSRSVIDAARAIAEKEATRGDGPVWSID